MTTGEEQTAHIRDRALREAIAATKARGRHRRVYRMEFAQPDGTWCSPFMAEWLTPEAFDVVEGLRFTMALDRPWPNWEIIDEPPGPDLEVIGGSTFMAMALWFGDEFKDLVDLGGHVTIYDVPRYAVTAMDRGQIRFRLAHAVFASRAGRHIPVEHLIHRRIHSYTEAP